MSKRLRFFILIGIFILGGVVLYPTFEWYFVISDDIKALAAGTGQEIRNTATDFAEEDKQQFVEMLNGVSNDVYIEGVGSSEDGLLALQNEAEERLKEDKKKLPRDATVQDIGAVYTGQNDVFYTLLDHYRNKILTIKDKGDRVINLGLDLSGGTSAVLQVNLEDLEERLGHSPSDAEIGFAIDRAMFILQNRIDKFGVREPRIRRQGRDSILIEVPGDNDREEINSFIKGKGTMAFQIVNEGATDELLKLQIDNPSWIYDKNNPPSFVPVGTAVLEYVIRDQFGVDQFQRWIAIYEDLNTYGIDGKHLQQAQVTNDNLTNQPLVNFRLDSEGAQILAKLTNDYLNQSMAIVLDGKVRAYAVLSAVINNGEAVISGFDAELAQDISTVLQTASLPVELQIVNQQVVGPTLGALVIQSGFRALIIGFLLVIVFTLIYYKGSGIIAVLALICNLFLLIALLSAFSFTATLTGIAGIILTVGMAIDANVLIFERIKEELALGKSYNTAIDLGFKKAFWSIVDANITTFIAAFFISQIASGPIQGFAVTLSIGIVTTLFSSLFISRLLFNFVTDVLKPKKLSISWRKL